MSTEKRIALAFFLSLLILFAFQSFIVPKQKKVSKQLHSNELQEDNPTINLVPPVPSSSEQNRTAATLETGEEEFFDQKLGKVSLTLANPGGYIKKITYPDYKEESILSSLLFFRGHEQEKHLFQETNQGLKIESKKSRTTITPVDDYYYEVKTNFSGQIELCSTEKAKDQNEQRYQEFFFGGDAQKIQHKPFDYFKKNNLKVRTKICGFRSRYYITSFSSQNEMDIEFVYLDNKVRILLDNKDLELLLNMYSGPEKIDLLRKYNLVDIMHYGTFHWIAIGLIEFLYFLFTIVHNWGFCIIIFSIAIFFIFFPLTAISTKSLKRMQALQPKIEDLKVRYKNEPQKLNKEIMELYRAQKVNPLSGCLPMLLQIPIFFALYQVLMRFVEIKGTSFLWIKDLSLPDALFTFPVSLPFIGNNFNILPILMAVLMFFQQKFNSPAGGSSEQQKMMTVVFPFLFGILFYNFPSGLVIYWFINSLLTTFYQFKFSGNT